MNIQLVISRNYSLNMTGRYYKVLPKTGNTL